jgi:hypothetical protein
MAAMLQVLDRGRRRSRGRSRRTSRDRGISRRRRRSRGRSRSRSGSRGRSRRGEGRARERHAEKKKRADLLLLKLLLIFLSQVLDDALMRLHQQSVLLVPLAVQQISLPCQRLIPARVTHVTEVELLLNTDMLGFHGHSVRHFAPCISGLIEAW